jgi:hypothetical protein
MLIEKDEVPGYIQNKLKDKKGDDFIGGMLEIKKGHIK